jgi:hypothetical protein
MSGGFFWSEGASFNSGTGGTTGGPAEEDAGPINIPGVPTGKPPVVFAGHGAFYTETDKDTPKVRLPPNVTMVFWCRHGQGLANDVAMFVESNRPLTGLPKWLKYRLKAAGRTRDVVGVPEIARGGTEIWNYRLTYPRGLDLASNPDGYTQPPAIGPVEDPRRVSGAFTTSSGVIRDTQYCIVGPFEGGIGQRGLPILAMIGAHMSICADAVVHWCACREVVHG